MKPLVLGRGFGAPPRILCVGAHCDDIEIGCGATLLQMMRSHPGLEIRWQVFVSDPQREAEARESAARFGLKDPADSVAVETFRDGYLPWEGGRVKEILHRGFEGFEPTIVFTHSRHDRHQDHRLLSDLSWNAYRDHLVLEFEIPKWDGDLGQPNFFVPLDPEAAERKLAILDEVYGRGSQRSRASFDVEVFRGLMRLRGLECGAASGFAEAFHARKVVFGGE